MIFKCLLISFLIGNEIDWIEILNGNEIYYPYWKLEEICFIFRWGVNDDTCSND